MSDAQGGTALAIAASATETGVGSIIDAINANTNRRGGKNSDMIVACAQILGQIIVNSGPGIAADMRKGIIDLIDGYSMQVAVGRHD